MDHGKRGIKESGKLFRCYPTIKIDIEELIREGWVRVVFMIDATKRQQKEESERKRLFFPRDLSNKEVELDDVELPLNCRQFLRDIWNEDVGENNNVKWE